METPMVIALLNVKTAKVRRSIDTCNMVQSNNWVPELICDPGSLIPHVQYVLYLTENQALEFFYFDFIIDTILLLFLR
jgi:hypothetical protein